MKYRVLSIGFNLNSFYLSFLYFRLFWLSDGRETAELLTYKYMLYSVFLVYPLFVFSAFVFSKGAKSNFFLRLLAWLLCLSGPLLFFYTFDLFRQKALFYGYMITLVQCLVQSLTVKNEEMIARVAGVFAAKLLLWFVVLLVSMLSLAWYSDRDILTNMLAGGLFYLGVGILDILIDKHKFLSGK